MQGPGSDRKSDGRQEKIGYYLPHSLTEINSLNDAVFSGTIYVAAVEYVCLWYKFPVL